MTRHDPAATPDAGARPVAAPDAGAPDRPLDLGPHARPVRRSLSGDHAGEVGTALPPLVDHHVHLMLVDLDRLAAGGLAGVVDLGAPLAAVAPLRSRGIPRVDFAGPFLTAEGGYPVGRSWAPAGSAREFPVDGDAGPRVDAHSALPSRAAAVVSELAGFGASVVKVALNAAAGPVLDPVTLGAIVAAARAHGLPVVAHVEGEGMTRLAIETGIDVLAHTPFSEPVDDDLVARAIAQGQRWISTLAIHGRGPDLDRAIGNLARFHAAGGEVLYGTDLGNGDQPLGVNPAELAAIARAGLGASDLIAALIDPWPRSGAVEGVATFVPGEVPARIEEVPGWLARAGVVPLEGLDALEAFDLDPGGRSSAPADPPGRVRA